MARNRAQQLCIVTLDYQRFLLPQADALKLIDIMSRAAEVQADYASGAGFKYCASSPWTISASCYPRLMHSS